MSAGIREMRDYIERRKLAYFASKFAKAAPRRAGSVVMSSTWLTESSRWESVKTIVEDGRGRC
jgi:hypothetical protein